MGSTAIHTGASISIEGRRRRCFGRAVHRTVIVPVAVSLPGLRRIAVWPTRLDGKRAGNGCSQRLGRRRGDGDRGRRRLRTAQRAVLHHSERVRRRLRLRVCLQQRARARPDGGRLHRPCRLSARSRAADSPASSQPIDARACRPAQCLRRRRGRHVQSGRRGAAVAGLFAQPRDRQGRRHRSRDVQGDRQLGRDAEPRAHRSIVGSADACGFRRM